MSRKPQTREIPPKLARETAAEIDALVLASGLLRIELLKQFWQAERGKVHNERPDRAANNFKQIMFKAHHGANLGKITWQELLDFKNFLKRHESNTQKEEP